MGGGGGRVFLWQFHTAALSGGSLAVLSSEIKYTTDIRMRGAEIRSGQFAVEAAII